MIRHPGYTCQMDDLRTIPDFPADRALQLSDKPLLDQLFARLQPRMSELTFAGLYLFRQAHAYRLSRIGAAILVLGRGYDGKGYVLPPLAAEPAAAVAQLLAAGIVLYVDQDFRHRHLADPAADVLTDRDNADYLYRRADLADLPGSRYHKKKNRVNYFTRRHEYQALLYHPQLLAGCLALQAEWERVNAANGLALPHESTACREALQLAETLGLQGVVITVAGRVVAFALGERLNATTAVCHFERAEPFLEGAYQLVNREFCRLLFADCSYVNREQDLGEAGLRQAKLSYHPVALIEKFKIYPRR